MTKHDEQLVMSAEKDEEDGEEGRGKRGSEEE